MTNQDKIEKMLTKSEIILQAGKKLKPLKTGHLFKHFRPKLGEHYWAYQLICRCGIPTGKVTEHIFQGTTGDYLIYISGMMYGSRQAAQHALETEISKLIPRQYGKTKALHREDEKRWTFMGIDWANGPSKTVTVDVEKTK